MNSANMLFIIILISSVYIFSCLCFYNLGLIKGIQECMSIENKDKVKNVYKNKFNDYKKSMDNYKNLNSKI
jgi:uncharacterized membrane protein